MLHLKTADIQKESYDRTAQVVARYVLNFEEDFEKANPARKKHLLKNCILGILVRSRKECCTGCSKPLFQPQL